MRQLAALAYPNETAGQATRQAGAARLTVAEPAPPAPRHPHPTRIDLKKSRHPSARIVQASVERGSRSRTGFGPASGSGLRGAGAWGGAA